MSAKNVSRIAGETVKMIGKGTFSTVYRGTENTDRVFIVSAKGIYDKECLKLAYSPNNPHLPVMLYAGEYYSNGCEYTVFETVYTQKPTKNDGEAYEMAKTLDRIWSNEFRNRVNLINSDESHVICGDFIEYLRDSGIVTDGIIDALDSIYSWATSFSSRMFFEFPMRNLGVDKNGNLVLRDVLFFR